MKALRGGCPSCFPHPRLQDKPKGSVGMYSLPWHAHNPEAWWLFQSCSLVTRAASASPPPTGFTDLPSSILYFHLTCDILAPASESSHWKLGALGAAFDVGGREAAARLALVGS